MEEVKGLTVAAPESADDLIVIKQLPIIQEQLRQIKDRVDETVEEALAMEVTEDTVKEIKKKRSELNQLATAFEDRRKEVKKAVLAPYDAFEAVYKECVIDAFKRADAELKVRIGTVESRVVAIKEADIIAYYAEYAQNLNLDFVKYEDMHITVKLSDSAKKLKEQIKMTLDRIHADAEMIQTLDDADEVMAEYRKTFDASAAIITVKNRHKAIEEEKRRAEERRAAEAARLEAERAAKERYEQLKRDAAEKMPQVEPITAAVSVSAPVEQKPVEDGNGGAGKFSEPVETFAATFTVYGTIEQLKAVKEFLNNGGYKYECE